MILLLALENAAVPTDGESSDSCLNDALDSQAMDAADHSKVGSCLLQARSASAASQREGSLDESAEQRQDQMALAEGSVGHRQEPVQQPSDDLASGTYWTDVEATLAAAAHSTPPPGPHEIKPVDQSAQSLVHGRLLEPWVQAWRNMVRDDGQPLNTRIGAALLYDVSVDELTLGTRTPPPTQGQVNYQLHANCPLVIFQRELDISPPLCGQSQGAWTDPSTKRVALRWEKQGRGMHFGADSAVDGNGSVTFASIQPQVVLKGYKFSLMNCMGTARWTIDESVIKVKHMGAHDRTMPQHSNDPNELREQYLLQYSVVADDGTVVLQTNLFRMFSDKVVFSMFAGNSAEPQVVALANRTGRWTGNGWRSCARNGRGWHLEFPQQKHDLNHAATLLDLRVAAAAIVTLMAARDEDRDVTTGLATTGDFQVFLSFAGTFVVMLQVALMACCCCCFCVKTGAKDKLKTFLFKLEGASMPKRPLNAQPPALNPAF